MRDIIKKEDLVVSGGNGMLNCCCGVGAKTK